MRIQGIGPQAVGDRDAKKTDPVAATKPVEAQDHPVVVAKGARGIAATVSRGEAAQADRVAALRVQVQNGNYRVDLDKLAERIADDELARSGR